MHTAVTRMLCNLYSHEKSAYKADIFIGVQSILLSRHYHQVGILFYPIALHSLCTNISPTELALFSC